MQGQGLQGLGLQGSLRALQGPLQGLGLQGPGAGAAGPGGCRAWGHIFGSLNLENGGVPSKFIEVRCIATDCMRLSNTKLQIRHMMLPAAAPRMQLSIQATWTRTTHKKRTGKVGQLNLAIVAPRVVDTSTFGIQCEGPPHFRRDFRACSALAMLDHHSSFFQQGHRPQFEIATWASIYDDAHGP